MTNVAFIVSFVVLALALVVTVVLFSVFIYKNRAKTPMNRLDVDEFQGTWYEIARSPSWFEKGCKGATATYTLRGDGNITVDNRCGLSGPGKAEGVAYFDSKAIRYTDPSTGHLIVSPAMLRVKFGSAGTLKNPFSASYNVVDSEGGWMAVSSLFGVYTWILSRTPTIPDTTYATITSRLKGRGFNVSRLRRQ